MAFSLEMGNNKRRLVWIATHLISQTSWTQFIPYSGGKWSTPQPTHVVRLQNKIPCAGWTVDYLRLWTYTFPNQHRQTFRSTSTVIDYPYYFLVGCYIAVYWLSLETTKLVIVMAILRCKAIQLPYFIVSFPSPLLSVFLGIAF